MENPANMEGSTMEAPGVPPVWSWMVGARLGKGLGRAGAISLLELWALDFEFKAIVS